MSRKLTKDELLKELFRDHYVPGQTKKLREVRVRVPGREMSLAHLIGVSQTEVYHNLGLHIGVHEGEDHTGDSIGLMKFTPWELTVVAADIALKSPPLSGMCCISRYARLRRADGRSIRDRDEENVSDGPE